MLAKVSSFGLKGIDAFRVSVEVDIAAGLPTYATVGLPDAEVREAKERVIAAIRNSGFEFPMKRVTVNLGPAKLKKGGTHFDLPIAMAIIAASGQLSKKACSGLKKTALAGELALDGTIRPVAGVLSMMLAAREGEFEEVILPRGNSEEAAISGREALCCETLASAVEHFEKDAPLPPCRAAEAAAEAGHDIDFSEVKSQALAKRALEIAAAGGHNLLMIGPPGTGKSMLAKRFTTILPPMTREEVLDVTRIYSVCGLMNGRKAVFARPFRDPHHTTSDIALAGGGSSPRPGEVSLAHNGVLFMDELPEFSRSSLEVLRQPLESFQVTVARAKESVVYPARFTLIAAMNPCPCGYFGHPDRQCSCTPLQIGRYRSRISGPLLDRIDLHVQLSPVRFSEWSETRPGESSAAIRGRVAGARELQRERFRGSSTTANAFMLIKELKEHCQLSQDSTAILESAMNRLGLSARSLDRILKVARTVADLEASKDIGKQHIMEVLQYRNMDRVNLPV